MIGHLVRHDILIKNLIKGNMEGKPRRGYSGINYFDQMKRLEEVKEKTLSLQTERRSLHRQDFSSNYLRNGRRVIFFG